MAMTVDEIISEVKSLYEAEGASVPDKIVEYCVTNTVAKVKAYCNIRSLPDGLDLLVIDIVRKGILLTDIAANGQVAAVTEGSATTQYHQVFSGLRSTEFADTVLLFRGQLNQYRRVGTF